MEITRKTHLPTVEVQINYDGSYQWDFETESVIPGVTMVMPSIATYLDKEIWSYSPEVLAQYLRNLADEVEYQWEQEVRPEKFETNITEGW